MNKFNLLLVLVIAFAALVCTSGVASAITLSEKYVGLDKIDLQWTRYEGTDFRNYQLCRDGTVTHTEWDQDWTTCRDEDLQNGTYYTYRIEVLNKTGGVVASSATETIFTGQVYGTLELGDDIWRGRNVSLRGDVTLKNVTLTIRDSWVFNMYGGTKYIKGNGLPIVEGASFTDVAIDITCNFTRIEGSDSNRDIKIRGSYGTFKEIEIESPYRLYVEGDRNTFEQNKGKIDVVGNFSTFERNEGKIQVTGKFHEIKNNNATQIKITGDNNAIVNNEIRDCDFGDGLYISEGNGSEIKGNMITNCSGNGIYLYNTFENVIIEHNTVTYAGEKGIYFYFYPFHGDRIIGGNHAILNNEIRDCGSDGLYMPNGNGSEIEGNAITNCSGKGIYLEDSSHCALSDNIVSNNSEYGIKLSGNNNNTLINNNASNNGGDGIHLWNSSINSLTNNNASNNHGDGISLSGSYSAHTDNSTLTDNTASNNGGNGISLSGNHSTLTNNLAVNNDGDGITLAFGEHNRLSNNTASHNGDDGIRLVFSNNNSLTNNTASGNILCGISLCLYSNNNSLIGNTASNNGKRGIWVYSSNNNTLTSNIASNNGVWGIELHNSSNNSLSNNTVSNSDLGIDLAWGSNNNLLTNNTVSNSGEYGIRLLLSSNNSLSTNTVSNSGKYGVWMGFATGNSLEYNLIQRATSDNDSWSLYVDISAENNQFTENTVGWSYPTKITFFNYFGSFNIRGVENPPEPPTFPDYPTIIQRHSISKYVEIQNLSADTDTTLFLYFHYEDEDVEHLNELSLKVWKHNGTAWDEGVGKDSWNGTRKLDTESNIVGVEIIEFCIFAPLAGLPVHNINTGEEFNTIQEAVDDSGTVDGHTITVDPEYTEAETKENIVVDKKLTIKSTSGNPSDTVIEAADPGKHVIEVTADDVTIQGFTIKGATEWKAGVHIHGSTIQGCTISQNFITENKCGIHLKGAKTNTIQENTISGNELSGIEIKGSGTEENKVIGNYIGTDKSGTKALGNQNGIIIWNGAKKNIIGGKESGEGNIISGNTQNGIYIFGLDTNENEILGNYMGTDKDGTNALPNEEYGVQIEGGCENWIGRYEGGRNVISGNKKGGVMLTRLNYYGAEHNEVLGNYIGTDKDGTKAVPNEGYGVSIISSSTNHIGGKLVGQTLSLNGNVISGNKKSGVFIKNFGLVMSNENEVLGNYIGTDKDGTTALPNEEYGVEIEGSVSYNFIGRYEGGRNVISGNKKSGIRVKGPNPHRNEILGNYIGTDKDGTSAVPNEEYGIEITNEATFTFVGGMKAYKTKGNVISGNKKGGILIKDPVCTGHANFVLDNLIGTNKDGTVKLPNEGYGIEIRDGASDNWIGSYEGGGNVISGNKKGGVLIKGKDTYRNEVLGNYIGTNKDGTAKLPNEGYGVELLDGPTYTRIGGQRGEKVKGNIISGNKNGGVLIKGETGANWILGNYIGTNKDGTVKLSNEGYGVEISVGPRSNYIGSEYKGQGNIISGNKKGGVLIKGKQGIPTGTTKVFGNYIGTNKDGTVKLPNEGYGVEMLDGTRNNDIHDNTIWYNCGGIKEKNSGPNRIYSNDIKYNTCSTGIHLDNSNSEIIGNTISDDEGDGIKCEDGSNPTINWNNIFNNKGFGLNNLDPSVIINAQNNWWGSSDGPGGAGPDSGDEVSDYVNYSNWLDAPVGVVPHIEVEKSVWDAEAEEWTYEIEADVDDVVRFQLFVHNDGVNCSLSNIVVNDTLPSNLEYADNATHEPDAIVGNRLTWNFAGPLEPCENITIEFDARVTECGDGVNVVNATAWCEELQYGVRDEDSAVAKVLPGIEVEKEVWDVGMETWVEEIHAEVGDVVTFQLWIHHDGTCCTISDIVVEDTLPEGLEFVSAESVPDEVIQNEDNTTTVKWNLIITLEPCENTTIDIKANVTKGGEHNNEVYANATGCGYEVSDTDEATVIVYPTVAPNITSFAPPSPVNDTVCTLRTFNVTVSQTVNVSWYLNEALLFTNESVREANCMLHAEEVGEHNVSAIVTNKNGTDMQTWIWNVTTVPYRGGPTITSFAPPSPVNDTVCNWRTFNVTVDQPVNVSWYLSDSLLFTNESVREADYTLHAEVAGEHNVSAIASNENGTDMQTWIWNVTEGGKQDGPTITSFAPPSPVNDTVCNWRTFNVTVDQLVNVSWYLNDVLLFTNESVREADYMLHAEIAGEHSVSASASNLNGMDTQTWIWDVTDAPTPTPTPKPSYVGGAGRRITPTPSSTPTPTPSPTPTPLPTPTPTLPPLATPTPSPTPEVTITATPLPRKVPGFGAVFAIVGLLAVAYILLRRRMSW